MTDPFASVPADVLAELRERHGEPGRAYHTWAHVEALLRWFAELRPRLHDPEAVFHAILFHDAVHDPTRGDNEDRSAALLRERMAGRLAPATLERAACLIAATQRHLVPPDLTARDAQDAAYVLDMDLSILGARPDVFDAYERNIRKEYAHLPEPAFRMGRAQVLRTFRDRERLYFSEWGRDAFEAAARANLARALQALAD